MKKIIQNWCWVELLLIVILIWATKDILFRGYRKRETKNKIKFLAIVELLRKYDSVT